ncbi:ribonuclease HII [Flavobacteriaceae bacterium LMO-SS05]
MKKLHSIIYLILQGTIIIMLMSCVNDTNKTSRLLNFAPDDTSVIINSHSIENLSLAIEHNVLLIETSKYSKLKTLKQQLQILKHLKIDSKFLICLSKTNTDSISFTIITKAVGGLKTLDSVSSITSETFTSKKYTITKTTINGQTLFSRTIDSVFIGSNTLSIVEDASPKKTMDPNLEQIYNTLNKEKSVSVILDLRNNKIKPSFFKDDALNQKLFSNYMLLDVDISQDNLVCNGITKATDSTKSLINVFKNTLPQENGIGRIAPSDVDYALSFTYNNFKTFNTNLKKISEKDSLAISTVFDNSIEIGLLQLDTQQAVVLHSIDASMTQEALGSQDISDTFREIPISVYEKPDIFQRTLSPLIHFESASKYIVLDNFFVFSDSTDFLKSIISNYQNKTTLSESSSFKNLMADLSDASSIFIYNNASSLNAVLNSNFAEELNLKMDSYKASAIQFIYDTNFAHVNAAFKTFKSKGTANSISEDLDITLDEELLSVPQLVTNHTNNQKDIIVQGINNNLYLISNQGKIFWKKPLEGKILGNIEQMDMYKNGRMQFVFATAHRVYVIDRNGKDVGPFPLKFRDNITQPLSLFDYDNNKNYRLLVTQGSSLLIYDQTGNSVKGFDFKKDNSLISSQPKHFRIGKKDYIVFSQGNKLKILDRTGRTRILVKNDINFSKNGIFLYNNNFITTNDKGILIQVDQKGHLSSVNLNLSTEHSITSTSKTLVTLSENRLTIKSRSVDLDYGEYTAPQIFYINDKIYVTTTDLQAKKIYLFDSLGKLIANFPIYGNSSIAMDNIDKDNNLEVITKGDGNSIIVYEIN